MSGHVLLIDLRNIKERNDVLPTELRPLVEGRLVMGSALQNDTMMLRGLKFVPARNTVAVREAPVPPTVPLPRRRVLRYGART